MRSKRAKTNEVYFSKVTKSRLVTKFMSVIAFTYCSPLYSQIEETAQRSTPMPNQGAYMAQVLLGLLFVIGLVFALAWILKRVGQGSLVGGQQMKVVAAMPMGTRERIALIDVGGQHILLGITPSQINTLHVFEEPIDLNKAPDASGSDFSAKLKEILMKGAVKS
mgnify:CR=1 FL=1